MPIEINGKFFFLNPDNPAQIRTHGTPNWSTFLLIQSKFFFIDMLGHSIFVNKNKMRTKWKVFNIKVYWNRLWHVNNLEIRTKTRANKKELSLYHHLDGILDKWNKSLFDALFNVNLFCHIASGQHEKWLWMTIFTNRKPN